MKRIIGILIVLLLLSGCDIGFNAVRYADEKCIAQYGSVFVNGHFTPISNFNTNVTVENCCCMGKSEFICICANKEHEVKKLFKS